MGRKLEAKDAARCALRSPWWTLGSWYADVANIAGWGEEQIEFMRERLTEEGRREDLLKGKSLEQVSPQCQFQPLIGIFAQVLVLSFISKHCNAPLFSLDEMTGLVVIGAGGGGPGSFLVRPCCS